MTSVTNVIECDKSASSSRGSDSDRGDLSLSIRDCHGSNDPRNDDAPQPTEATERVPLYERIYDMFPDLKPQQSMAAYDDDCPF